MVSDSLSPNKPATTDSPLCSLIRAELAQIAERFEAADRRAKRAATIADREAAEAERREAGGDFWSAGNALGELGVLFVRYARQYQPDALRLLLVEVLRPELEPLAQAITKLEARV
jgi:hypothetical protein